MQKHRLVYTILNQITAFMILGASLFAQENIQPLRFNHDFHIEDLGLLCLDCHKNAERQERASIPNIYECSECHEDEFDNVEADKVAGYINSDTKIPWIKVHQVPDHAFFSHRRHVSLGQIECRVCHGEVRKMAQPFQKPFIEMDMDWCLDCHEKNQVTEDCSGCHR